MAGKKTFPSRQNGRFYLSEGGPETELMYKHGYELPQFAMFPLLDNPDAVTTMQDMYRKYLDVVAKHGMSALIGGLDYRASPDWGEILGYSAGGLAEANLACINFLNELAAEYKSDIPEILIQGIIGPRGDAYAQNKNITASEAEDYHSVQLQTLKKADIDLALAVSFNNIPESIGIARAAEKIGVPLGISLSLDCSSKLNSGPHLSDAIIEIDIETNQSPAFYSINCSHPLEYEPALIPGDWINRVRGVRPNAAKIDKIQLCSIGHLEDGDPVKLGEQIGSLARRYPHMDIWGGCCGSWDVHLDEIAKNVLAVHDEISAHIEAR
jgi:S-methylmethionine-dependent homocysteine/selenocysteine methylase